VGETITAKGIGGRKSFFQFVSEMYYWSHSAYRSSKHLAFVPASPTEAGHYVIWLLSAQVFTRAYWNGRSRWNFLWKWSHAGWHGILNRNASKNPWRFLRVVEQRHNLVCHGTAREFWRLKQNNSAIRKDYFKSTRCALFS